MATGLFSEASSGKMNWGDVSDEEYDLDTDEVAFLPAPKAELGSDGTCTTTRYRRDEEGNVLKTVTTVRSKKVTHRVAEAAIKRRGLAKFGDCGGKPRGTEKGITSVCYDPVTFEYLGAFAASKNKENDGLDEGDVQHRVDRMLRSVQKPSAGEGRSKLAAHFQALRKKLGVKEESLAAQGIMPRFSAGGGGGGRSSGGRYVPPSRRGGRGGDKDESEEYTMIITNLPEETTREDIYELLRGCSYNGARGRSISVRSRGIWGFSRESGCVRYYKRIGDKLIESNACFCSFDSERDAKMVIENIRGHRYGGLILGCERAKSRNQMDKSTDSRPGAGARPLFALKSNKPKVIPGMT